MNPAATTSHEPQLGLFESRPGDANVVWLESFLQEQGRWIRAGEILRWHGRDDSEDQKRLIRSLASASEWIISGQAGYKHLQHATPEEIAHAANSLESQAKKMSDRACALRRNAHRRIG